ncbi:hypothetical protein [Pseudoalteromonas sp. PPB1]|uniref:hypothetical protein n=2 Tax=unclassified Pseudoalteromonas TaxID=194690 RepID=UPI001891B231|nr:hypothetical protein [Pseudoalteromonas sp. PPB1]
MMTPCFLPVAAVAALSLPAYALDSFDINTQLFSFASQGHTIYLETLPVPHSGQMIRLRFWAQCKDQQCDDSRFVRQMVRDLEWAMPREAVGVSDKADVLPCQNVLEGCWPSFNTTRMLLETDVTFQELTSFDLNIFELLIVSTTPESGSVIPIQACTREARPGLCLVNDNFQFTTLSPTSFSVTYEANWNDADQRDDEQELHRFTQRQGYHCKEQAHTMTSHVRVTLTCEHQGE